MSCLSIGFSNACSKRSPITVGISRILTLFLLLQFLNVQVERGFREFYHIGEFKSSSKRKFFESK